MDRHGGLAFQSDFTFFTRASREICDLIADNEISAKTITLCRYVREIGNERLRRALEASLEIEQPTTKIRKLRSRSGEDIWKGLPIRL